MEKRDLYDINQNLTGETIVAGGDIPQGRYILAVMTFMQNSKGEFLIQMRSQEKGGKHGTTGGHPKTGESNIQGMVTEIKEEIGLTVNENELEFMYSGLDEFKQRFYTVYYLKKDFDIADLVLQKEEVAFVEWMTVDKIRQLISSGEFKRSHAEEFEKVLGMLEEKSI